MKYVEFLEIINKHLYLVQKEHFSNDQSDIFVTKFVMKHPLLKPELIVENDHIQGFKSAGKRLVSLEKFPIYVEIEGELDPDTQEKVVTNVDLYSEANLKCQDRLSDVMYLAKRFKAVAILDRIIRLSNTHVEYLVIFSKLQEIMSDAEDGEVPVDSDVLKKQIKKALLEYVNFIQCLHEVILKGKSITACEDEGLC